MAFPETPWKLQQPGCDKCCDDTCYYVPCCICGLSVALDRLLAFDTGTSDERRIWVTRVAFENLCTGLVSPNYAVFDDPKNETTPPLTIQGDAPRYTSPLFCLPIPVKHEHVLCDCAVPGEGDGPPGPEIPVDSTMAVQWTIKNPNDVSVDVEIETVEFNVHFCNAYDDSSPTICTLPLLGSDQEEFTGFPNPSPAAKVALAAHTELGFRLFFGPLPQTDLSPPSKVFCPPSFCARSAGGGAKTRISVWDGSLLSPSADDEVDCFKRITCWGGEDPVNSDDDDWDDGSIPCNGGLIADDPHTHTCKICHTCETEQAPSETNCSCGCPTCTLVKLGHCNAHAILGGSVGASENSGNFEICGRHTGGFMFAMRASDDVNTRQLGMFIVISGVLFWEFFVNGVGSALVPTSAAGVALLPANNVIDPVDGFIPVPSDSCEHIEFDYSTSGLVVNLEVTDSSDTVGAVATFTSGAAENGGQVFVGNGPRSDSRFRTRGAPAFVSGTYLNLC